MRRATVVLFVSAIIALTAASVCTPFSDASEPDSVSIIIPRDGLSIDDPMGLILGFEYVSAEVGRSHGTVLVLMTGASYEDDELFVAVTEAIGPDRFITGSELDALRDFDIVGDRPLPPPGRPPVNGVDLDFLEQMLAFVDSCRRWEGLADDISSEIDAQKIFTSRLNACCVYWESKCCEVGTDRREDDQDDSDGVKPIHIEERGEEQSEVLITVERDSSSIEVQPEVGDSGDLPVIGRGTVV